MGRRKRTSNEQSDSISCDLILATAAKIDALYESFEAGRITLAEFERLADEHEERCDKWIEARWRMDCAAAGISRQKRQQWDREIEEQNRLDALDDEDD